MLIQPVQFNAMSNDIKMPKFVKHSINTESDSKLNNADSIYSKGMTNIAFGNIVRATTSFEKEIAEQPEVLGKLIKKYFSKSGKINLNLDISNSEVDKLRKIHIFASGSSKNSAEMAQSFMEKMVGIPVFVHSASEAMNSMKPLNSQEDVAIFVSQSGGTADTYATLDIAKKAGLKTFAITNNSDSKIAKTVDSHIPLEAGEEKAVAATKTVTSSILNLMAIGMKLGELKGVVNEDKINNLSKQFAELPESIELMLQKDSDVKQAADKISKTDNIYYYAKGNSVGAAREGALKLTETTGKRVIADASGEALHGTFASIKPEDIVLQVVNFENSNIAKQNAEEIIRKRHVKNPIIMQPSGLEQDVKSEYGKPIYIEYPNVCEDISPILTTIRFQQITNEVTKKLGINPDNGGGFLTKFRQDISM